MRLLAAAALAGLLLPAPAAALNIVATTEDLASLVREVGGDKVKVEGIARGYQDPHFVEAKPSFILKLHAADLLVVVGRELEIGWLPPLLNQCRNPKIQPGAEGHLDASLTARILEIPTGQVTRAMGDVHPQGNPHYWLDPGNGRRIAAAIRDRLSSLDRANAAFFAQRYADFDRRLAAAEARWDAAMAPHEGLKVVTYHRSWPNFTERFGLDVIGYVEPRPGIPPSPGHTVDLIKEMKRLGVKVLIIEPYFDSKTPDSIGRETGARVVVMPPSVGGEKEIADYIGLFDHNVALLLAAIRDPGAR
ncbi:MAG: metal ABC transporter substrate-binding protein [Vicinamibacteria bacterium]|nr:metal ABC transporter substrate-binding protein [Vicinamibacteria bacterium]